MKIAYLFPGQGAQYVGMGQEFYKNFSIVKNTFEEASDICHCSFSELIFEGPEDVLKMTKNAQMAIFVTSIAILRAIEKEFPHIHPFCAAGLSLGEYTALCASKSIPFAQCLPLVQKRALLMHEACEQIPGTMAAVIKLSSDEVEKILVPLKEKKVWAANFNCPGQVVISGTEEGVSIASTALKEKGARIIPLKVHGAFHSGLMLFAKEKLTPYIQDLHIAHGSCPVVMNVLGDFITDPAEIKKALIEQVTGSVYWEKGIRNMRDQNVDVFLEIGPGTVLTGLNKKIGIAEGSYSIQKLEDMHVLSNILGGSHNVKQ